jgi:DNA-binding transcriptional regulator YbjK
MGRQPRGEERRHAILRATLAVAGRGGIPAVTHRSVAEEAGVPLGSLTYYFGSKDDLLREALLLFVAEEAERLREVGAALAGQHLDLSEVAHGFALVLAGEGETEQVAQFELYLEAARNPALREPAAECFRIYEEITTLALRAAGAKDPERSAGLFVALTDGIGLRRLAAPGTAPELVPSLVALFEGVAEGRIGAPSRG